MKRPFVHSAHNRADESVRAILRRLFHALLSQIDGVLEDSDTEFLHDLRVANRRTRTLLSQIKGVLPTPVVDAFSPEFKWLGDVTGPCRDLDVIFLEMVCYRERSEIDECALGALRQFLEDKRRAEHDRVSTTLRSTRFHLLVEGWGRFLETTTVNDAEPPHASTPIIEVAGPRIFKAYRRIWKRGVAIDADAPATVLHRIRIDGKKLRYLLEFFSDLYPRTTVTRFIKELKELQDILGGFNDTEIQLTHIAEFTDQLTAPASVQPDILSGASRLGVAIAERQRRLRADFVDHFALFAGDDSRRLYRKTFGGS